MKKRIKNLIRRMQTRMDDALVEQNYYGRKFMYSNAQKRQEERLTLLNCINGLKEIIKQSYDHPT